MRASALPDKESAARCHVVGIFALTTVDCRVNIGDDNTKTAAFRTFNARLCQTWERKGIRRASLDRYDSHCQLHLLASGSFSLHDGYMTSERLNHLVLEFNYVLSHLYMTPESNMVFGRSYLMLSMYTTVVYPLRG